MDNIFSFTSDDCLIEEIIPNVKYKFFPDQCYSIVPQQGYTINLGARFILKDHIITLEILPTLLNKGLVTSNISFTCDYDLYLPVFYGYYPTNTTALSSFFNRDNIYLEPNKGICYGWIRKM